jgi:hypothetical protein
VLPPVSLHDRLDVGGGVQHQSQPPPLHQDTGESPRHGGGVALAAPNGCRRRRREPGVVGRRRRKSAATGAAGIGTSVSDPDPDPDWIRILSGQWNRIRIRNLDPGGQK